MNYQLVVVGNQPNDNACIKENLVTGKVQKETVFAQQYVLLPLWSTGLQDPQNTDDDVDDAAFDVKENENNVNAFSTPVTADGPNLTNITNSFNTASPSDTAVSLNFRITRKSLIVDPFNYLDDPNMPELEDIVYSDDEEDVGAKADLSNLETNIPVSPIQLPELVKEQGGLHQINDEDFHTCMFACFLSQEETKKVHQALKDPSWIEAMQEELLQFKMQKGHTQEEGIDYDEVFAPVARIEAIRLFLAYASFMGFMVYQMDVKSVFLYGTIKEEVYVCQPPGFKDPDYPDKVYKVVKELYELHQAPRAWYEILANYILENGFQRGKIDQTLFIKKQKGDILLVQVYVDDIIFGSTNKELYVKLASTPIETEKPLLKDPDGEDVDVHIYRYLKGKPHLGLWYPKDSPFNLVAYSDSDYARASLDMKSTTGGCQFLGCTLISWHCKKQTFVATSSTEAEYVAVASYCAQTVVSSLSIEAEYVDAASCCAQVQWI
nr:putative ribonuclease H-like domain-containing protein [Tanacetum cinerariifolium]